MDPYNPYGGGAQGTAYNMQGYGAQGYGQPNGYPMQYPGMNGQMGGTGMYPPQMGGTGMMMQQPGMMQTMPPAMGMYPNQMGGTGMYPNQMGGTGMMQPGMMGPGMMQPGMMGPGMMQPGMMGPGMMQPGMMGPGMMQPGMMPGAGAAIPGGPKPGMFNIKICNAENLKGGLIGNIDPYVIVKYGTQKQKTGTALEQGGSPVWNKTISFKFEGQQPIEFCIFDKDIMSSDDEIANGKLAGNQWEYGYEGVIPLQRKKGKAGGSLRVSIKK